MKVDWNGVFPALTTQFHRDLSLDLNATGQHIEVMIDSGVHGLVMLGSLGENTSLSLEEKRQVLKLTKEIAKGKVPVISGVAEYSAHAAIDYMHMLEEIGIDGAMVMPAMVYRADRAEAMQHFKQIAANTRLPIIVYNNPLSYHVDVTPEMFQELSSIDNLVAIKESSGDIRRVTDLINAVGDRYVIFGGVDDLALEAAFLGATGWIAGIGLAFPKENQRIWDLAMAGKWTEARDLYRWYTPLLHLDVGTKFVQNIKLCIQEVGLGAEWVRMPRLLLEGKDRDKTLAIIHEGIKNRPLI